MRASIERIFADFENLEALIFSMFHVTRFFLGAFPFPFGAAIKGVARYGAAF